jgi:Ca-activated chloride channel family protein
VSDLGRDDFVVREDGRPQQVQVFGAAAEHIHAGEKSPRTADLYCTRCGQVVHVTAGETVPECPNGHTTFDFGERKELALSLGMLFDTSESMREQLRLSQESAIRFLDAIPRAKDLLLVFFDRDIRISRYDSENQQGIFERILETKSAGKTALRDAIAVYLSRVWDAPGRKVLVLFSDGDDTTSSVSMEEVLKLVRSTTVTVYPVDFRGEYAAGSLRGRRAGAFLSSLATASGGRVFQPRASKELAAIYQTILDELGSQYVLGYVSDNPARDGRYRRIEVEVKRPGLRLRYRPGYNAPKEEPAAKGK